MYFGAIGVINELLENGVPVNLYNFRGATALQHLQHQKCAFSQFLTKLSWTDQWTDRLDGFGCMGHVGVNVALESKSVLNYLKKIQLNPAITDPRVTEIRL